MSTDFLNRITLSTLDELEFDDDIDEEKKKTIEFIKTQHSDQFDQHIDYAAIEANLDLLEQQAVRHIKEALIVVRDRLLQSVENNFHKDKNTAFRMLKELKLKGMRDVQLAFSEFLRGAFQTGHTDLSFEVGGRVKHFASYGFDPSQPRDEQGQWSDGGGSISSDLPAAILTRESSRFEGLVASNPNDVGSDKVAGGQFYIDRVLSDNIKTNKNLSLRKGRTYLYVVTSKGEVSGALAGRMDFKTSDAKIEMLGSLSAGNGRKLVNEYTNTVKNKYGAKTISAEVDDSNIGFYTKTGFSISKELEGGSYIVSKKISSTFSATKAFQNEPLFSPQEALRWLDAKKLTITGVLNDKLVKQAQIVLSNALKFGEPMGDTLQKLTDMFEPFVGNDRVLRDGEPIEPSQLQTIIRTNATEAYNQGRLIAARDPDIADFMQAMKYSAVLDQRTTEVCRFLDGKIIPMDEPELDRLSPPNHHNCRSILVPVPVGISINEDDIITASDIGKAEDLIQDGFK